MAFMHVATQRESDPRAYTRLDAPPDAIVARAAQVCTSSAAWPKAMRVEYRNEHRP
jgi:hypothetical protein